MNSAGYKKNRQRTIAKVTSTVPGRMEMYSRSCGPHPLQHPLFPHSSNLLLPSCLFFFASQHDACLNIQVYCTYFAWKHIHRFLAYSLASLLVFSSYYN
jgi:hypothetical protein